MRPVERKLVSPGDFDHRHHGEQKRAHALFLRDAFPQDCGCVHGVGDRHRDLHHVEGKRPLDKELDARGQTPEAIDRLGRERTLAGRIVNDQKPRIARHTDFDQIGRAHV